MLIVANEFSSKNNEFSMRCAVCSYAE